MTIHEFNRYIPMGSKIALFLWDERHTNPQSQEDVVGIVTNCHYENDRTHYIQLRSDNGQTLSRRLSDIAYTTILEMPDDYGTGDNGSVISEAVAQLLENTNRLISTTDGIRPSLKEDFSEQAEVLAVKLEHYGLSSAALQIRSLACTAQSSPMPEEEWCKMFSSLYQVRTQAEKDDDPDILWLRRCEALLCIYAKKKHFLPNPLHYAARLIALNLIQEKAQVLSPSAYEERRTELQQALDWFLLAHVYYATGKQESLAHVAMVQSVLHRGSLFQNQDNRKVFFRLCGGSHDFTFIKQLLSRIQSENGHRDAYPEQHLLDLGRLMCWMLYQLGGAGIADASELIHYVEAQSHNRAQLQQLHELMLAYAYKYAPRNRKDRFLIVSAAMDQILTRLQEGDPLLDSDTLLERMKYDFPLLGEFDVPIHGYIYEFHGRRGIWMNDINGHILGTDLMPYWFSFPKEDTDLDTPIQLLNLYSAADEENTLLLVTVEFKPGFPGPHGSRLRAEELLIVSGGNIAL